MKIYICIIVLCLSSSLVQAKQIPTLEAKIMGYNYSITNVTWEYLDSIAHCFPDDMLGAYVESIVAGGVLEQHSKIRSGDVIISLDDKLLFHPIFIDLVLEKKKVGEQIEVEYIKGGETDVMGCDVRKETIVLSGQEVANDYRFVFDILVMPMKYR